MELMSLLKERQLSVYQCAKESHVPYTTLSDIVKLSSRVSDYVCKFSGLP